MEKERIALLDTDFTSKTFQSSTEDGHLIDCILALPDYKFCCHEQVCIELGRRFAGATSWLQKKIDAGVVSCYSDKEILRSLCQVYGDGCCYIYAGYLKKACDAYGKDFFSLHYQELTSFDVKKKSQADFLALVEKGDLSVGSGNDLGEIKTAVLLQMLVALFGCQAYLFCSDDKKARNGMLTFDDVTCLSVLTAFWKLKKDCGMDSHHARPYFVISPIPNDVSCNRRW